MFEVQMAKIAEARRCRAKVLGEIAEFLNKMLKELADEGIKIYNEDEYGRDPAFITEFSYNEDKNRLEFIEEEE